MYIVPTSKIPDIYLNFHLFSQRFHILNGVTGKFFADFESWTHAADMHIIGKVVVSANMRGRSATDRSSIRLWNLMSKPLPQLTETVFLLWRYIRSHRDKNLRIEKISR